MSRYIVGITAPAPLVGFWRWEGEAFSAAAARIKALRETGAPSQSTATVRPADDGTYDAMGVDSGFALFGTLPAIKC